jgi:hypothetical protein
MFWQIDGRGSTATSETLYGSAMPAMSTFTTDSLALLTSTPTGASTQMLKSYEKALSVDPETGRAADPASWMLQLPADEPYLYSDLAHDLEMWPGGASFATGLTPKITRGFIEAQRIWDPVGVDREYEAQVIRGADSYLLADKAGLIFAPYGGARLVHVWDGKLGTRFVAHVDPSKSGANFAVVVGHLEFDSQGPP